MYTLTDNTTGIVYELDTIWDLEEKLDTLFDRAAYAYTGEDGADHTVGEVIDGLISKHNQGEYAGGEEACLNVTIE